MKRVLLLALLVLSGCDNVKEIEKYTVVDQAKRACSETGLQLYSVEYGPMSGPNVRIVCREPATGKRVAQRASYIF